MNARHETGFSTPEVIAAVAIIAIALVPIASLQTQIVRGQARLAEVQRDTSAVQNALAHLRGVNPMLAPTGRRDIGAGATLSWTSEALSNATPSVNPRGFEVQLFRVDGEIRASDGAVTTIALDLVGWRPLSDADN